MDAEIHSLPRGARFFRGDLHIHSYGGSHDVKDTACTPEAIVKTAKEVGLDIIAIADHNEITAVATAESVAKSESIMLVPAIELSTSQGHLLCYLPSVDALNRFYAKLTIADRGKNTSHCQQSMLECMNLLEEHGGFAVLAHVDAGSGFETMNSGNTPHKKNILCHKALVGVELAAANSKVSYSNQDPDPGRKALGQERINRLELGPQQFLARVLNSDSHTLEALGRNAAGDKKVTRFKMNGLNFESLHIAMIDCDARVRIEEEVPPIVPQVVGIRMSGGFLKDQAIHFSNNLNCIIGGRGTGKSTTFEAIRCLTGYPGEPAPVVDSEVWPEQVDLLVQDQAAQFHEISRAKEGVLENGADPLSDPISFPIECYRQGETYEISQRAQSDPSALLEYLDRFIEVRDDLEKESGLRDRLLDLQSKIEEANDRIDRIPKTESDLKRIKEQIAAIEKERGKEVIAIQRTVAQELRVRDTILEQAKEVAAGATITDIQANVDAIKKAGDPAALRVGADEFEGIVGLATAFEKKLAASEATLKANASALIIGIQEKLKAWKAKAQRTADQIETKKKALEAKGIRVDVAYFQKLATDEARLAAKLQELERWKPHRAKLNSERNVCLKERWECREHIATKRAAFATKASEALKAALTDLHVSLKFDRSAYSPEANDIIIKTMGWRTIQVPRASAITERLTVSGLLSAIAKKDSTPLANLKWADGKRVFSKSEANSVLERLGESPVRYQLERCEVVDRPRLTVTRLVTLKDGKKERRTREFNKLSLGQQQSILLALVLSAEHNVPLIIDQPEDNLDSEFIYRSIVPVLRRAKERRQIIVVTHNANVAVLGDAEQVIVLKSTAAQASITARGSIDDVQTREAACTILEGSRNAFKRRARFYGLRVIDVEAST